MKIEKVPLIHKQGLVKIEGCNYTLKEASDKFNVNIATITNRYNRGYRGDKLIARRLKKGASQKKINIRGEKLTYQEISKKYNINLHTLRARYVRDGLRGEDLIANANRGNSTLKVESLDSNVMHLEIGGYSYTLGEVANKLDLNIDILMRKYESGIRGIDLLVQK